MSGIIGKKVGMTQVVTESGEWIPVTLVRCEAAEVVRVKTQEKDKYEAVVVGLKVKRPTKNKIYKNMVEFKMEEGKTYQAGDLMDLGQMEGVETVSVIGVSKGKGFQGVIKRHNFASGPGSHGSKHHRQPGSIGTRKPRRTHKGKKLAGRMGTDQITLHGRKVMAVDKATNCVAIKGALPGAINSILIIKK